MRLPRRVRAAMSYRRKVLIIDDNILDVMEAEKYLREAGYDVAKLASPNGCVAKIDYEKPEILLIDISMSRLNAQELFSTVQNSPEHEDLIIVLFSDLDAETLRGICVEHDFHGYFCKSMGLHQIGKFLDNFYEETV
jgi:PleD family two-component response regulator